MNALHRGKLTSMSSEWHRHVKAHDEYNIQNHLQINSIYGKCCCWYIWKLAISTSSQHSSLHNMNNKFQQKWCITVDTLSLFCLVQYFTFPCKYYTDASRRFTEKLKPPQQMKTCTDCHWKSPFAYLNFPGNETSRVVWKVKLTLRNWPDIFISCVSNSEGISS